MGKAWHALSAVQFNPVGSPSIDNVSEEGGSGLARLIVVIKNGDVLESLW